MSINGSLILDFVSLGKLLRTVKDSWVYHLKPGQPKGGKKTQTTSNFIFIRRQVVSVWVIFLGSLAGYRWLKKTFFFSVYRKANRLNDILKLTLSRREKNCKFLWPLLLPKSIFFVSLGKEIRNIWVQWKGNYEFQKRNKLKTLLRRMYFRARVLNRRGFSFGVKIWSFQIWSQ